MASDPKIKNVLWFDGQAEAAAKHYMAAFKESARKNRVFAAMVPMTKFDVAALERVYAGTQ